MIRYFPIVLAFVILVIIVIVLQRRRGQQSLPDYHIQLCIPFAGPASINVQTIQQQFKQRWKMEVACGQAPQLGSAQDGVTTYLMGNGIHNVRLTVSRNPLPANLVNATIGAAPALTDAEKTAIEKHQGYISLEYLHGPEDPAARVRFAAQTLLTLAQLDGALGYVSVPAMLYRPRIRIDDFLGRTELNSTDLYLLFVNSHSVDDKGTIWLHTHGLEGFDLPDLQVRFSDGSQQRYYWELLSEASVYMIERGPVFKAGDTAELTGDGVIYEIKSVRPDANHPFGFFGCLEIVRR